MLATGTSPAALNIVTVSTGEEMIMYFSVRNTLSIFEPLDAHSKRIMVKLGEKNL